MTFQLIFTERAKKQFLGFDKFTQVQIGNYIDRHFSNGASVIDPRTHGRPLTGPLKGYWRYKIGKYRLICDINDNICTVIVVKAAHRREAYR